MYTASTLGMRRDIAMLGILFKVASGIGPQPIGSLFSLRPSTLEQHGFLIRPRHSKQIMDPVAFNHPVVVKRSIYGLIRVFNALPQGVVDSKSVNSFQKQLQNRAKVEARTGAPGWEQMYHAD